MLLNGLHLLGMLLSLALAAAQPSFEVRALGVLGGDTDTNLTSFLVGKPGGTPTLMIDGGSVTPGIRRMLELSGKLAPDASPSARAWAALDVIRPLEAVLLTHSHLDHWAGLANLATIQLELAGQGDPSLRIVGLPASLEALRRNLFESRLWSDFTKLPKGNPAFRLHPLAPGKRAELGGFKVEDVPVSHAVPSAAFFLEHDGVFYLHVGDTGATAAVWKKAAPLLKAGKLRGLALEVSYPAVREELAITTGHLTRSSFLLELNKLAGAVKDPPKADGMTDAQALELARALAPAFRNCPVMVIHVKALGYDKVVQELSALRGVGLNLLVPEQGRTYEF